MIRLIAYLSVLFSVHAAFGKSITDKTVYSKQDMTVSATPNMGEEFQNFALLQTTLSAPETRTFVLNEAYGIVQLYYPATAANIPTSGTAQVSLEITYTVEENNALVERQQTSTLSIQMSPAGFKPLAYVRLDHAIKVSARITAVSIPATGFDDLKLEFRIESEVFEKMLNSESVTGIQKHLQYIPTEGSLEVAWDAMPKAEGYELEWTYVSNQDPNDVTLTLTPAQIHLRDNLFKTNSSRVEITANSYKIPLIYEKGLILYRIRPIGRNIANGSVVVVKGAWTLEENLTSLGGVNADHYYEFSGLEENMNWQSSLSFAEEGKNKVVLSYHDGTARNRQAVTRINTDERAIVGETLYDYNGRPTIQMLPVPTVENNLYFYPQFNKMEGNTSIPSKEKYDLATQGSGCFVNAPPFDINSGASGYYSTLNPFTGSGTANTGINIINRNLIPDAEKYPYTQTQYTNDNTGRIAAQSGVGSTHKLNSGHETKYLYGTPDQEELSRLFGTQVGINGHYKKNVVVDPNGQVSVSYLDMDGKVVATALAGGNPGNLTALDGDKARHINSHLLTTITNVLSEDKRSKTYLKKLVVTQNNTPYVFSYNYSAPPYTILCKNKTTQAVQPINLSAVLDAEIKLEKCGSNEVSMLLSSNAQFANGTTQSGNSTANKTLNIGEYNLTKTIKINEVKLNEYVEQYLNNTAYACVISVSDYVNDSIDIVDLSGCGYSCETCQTSVEAVITRLDEKRLETGSLPLTDSEKEGMRSKCYDLCRSNITCAAALNGMITDMTIGGQYAEIREKNIASPQSPSIDADDFVNNGAITSSDQDVAIPNDPAPNTGINVSKFRLSVFNPDNLLTVPPFLSAMGINRADWHKPIRVIVPGYPNTPQDYNQSLFKDGIDLTTATYAETDYYGSDGRLVYARLIKVSTNVYLPEIHSSGLPHVVTVNEETGEYKVPIKHLKDIAVFETYWKPHFGNYLVMYHPEFMYFVDCTTQQDINEFEYKLVTAETLADDTQHLFTDANGVVTIIENDPLFDDNEALKKRFTLLFNNYKIVNGSLALTMVQTANLGSKCPVSSVVCPGATCPSTTLSTTDATSWSLFKALYITERQKILRDMARTKAIGDNYYNGCIGDPDFITTNEAAPFFQYVPHTVSKIVYQWDCDGWWGWKGCSFEPREIQHTYYSIPYYDSRQTCYSWRSRFYGDKTRLFYPKVYGAGDLQQGRCIRQVFDPETNTNIDLVVDCQEDEENFIDQINDAVARKRYEECGLCPIASDIQDFVIQTQRKKLLNTTTPVVLSCPPGASLLMMGGTLTQEFKVGTTIPPIRWSASYNATTRILTGELSSSVDNTFTPPTKTIRIKLNFNSLPSGMAVDFTKLKICCLTPLDATHFKMRVYYTGVYNLATNAIIASTDMVHPGEVSGYAEASFEIDGEVENVSLTHPCSIAPNCAATSTAKHIVGFLNILNKEVINDKAPQMVSATEVALSSATMAKYYEYSLRNLLNINQVDANGDLATTLSSITPKWQSTIDGTGRLMGTLSYGSSSQVNINIQKVNTSGGALNFTQVQYFTNVQPVTDLSSCPTNQCRLNSFTADAVTIDGNNNKIYTKVEIVVPNYTMSICEKAVVGN